MVKAADAKGKTSDDVLRDDNEQDVERAHESEFVAPASSRGKGLSFKVLQWLTDTADDEENDAEVESRSNHISLNEHCRVSFSQNPSQPFFLPPSRTLHIFRYFKISSNSATTLPYHLNGEGTR